VRVYLKPSEVTIRKAEFKDIPFCLEVEASQEDNTFSERDFRNSITDSAVIFLVAEEKERVVGFFWALLCQQGEKRL
jgi:ribosomal protein S18 acetylase RimI-like enzyme